VAALQAPSVRRQRLGVALRRLRDRAGLTTELVGRRLGWSASKVSRIETARIGVSVSDVRRLLKLYGADAQMADDLLMLASQAKGRGWWDSYPEVHFAEVSAFIALEDEASSVRQFQTELVPGLLQTEEYARCLIEGWGAIMPTTSPATMARRLEVRTIRQRLLEQPRSLPISLVLDESVLLRRIGSPGTMVRQMVHLAELATLPNVALHVLPLGGEHTVGPGSFVLLEFPSVYDVALPPVVYTETIIGAANLQDDDATHVYRLCHDLLVSHSLDTAESISRISKLAQRHWSNF